MSHVGFRPSERRMLATSHEGRYAYWLDPTDLYVYQRMESTGRWMGWLCSLSAWEHTFSKSTWITLTPEVTA